MSRTLVVLFLVACDGVTSGDLLWSNEGQVCVAPSPTTDTTASPTTATSTGSTTAPVIVDFVDGGTAQVEVTFGGCDCGETLTTKSCTATRDGERWSVVSEARTPEEGCEPCIPIVATCDVGVLLAGSHSFEHGGDLLVVTVPSSTETPCAGEPVDGTPE